MAEQMNLAGFWVDRITIIPDEKEQILASLNETQCRSAIVLVTGGLGPTGDDITKEVLCQFFNTRLIFQQEAYNDVENIFKKRGIPITDINRRQAELPENCTTIPNPNGTARGMWFTNVENRRKTDFILCREFLTR